MRLITKRSTRRTGSVRKGRCIRIDLDDLEVIEDRQQLVRVRALMSNNDLVLFAIVRDVEARRRRAVATRREDGHISQRVALFAARQVLHAFSRAVNRSREERRSYELRADVCLRDSHRVRVGIRGGFNSGVIIAVSDAKAVGDVVDLVAETVFDVAQTVKEARYGPRRGRSEGKRQLQDRREKKDSRRK